MKKKLYRVFSALMMLVLFLPIIPHARAAEFENPFEIPGHVHIGGCEFICNESEKNNASTTLSIRCQCGEDIAELNMCPATCAHNFETSYKEKTFESDVCNICGYLRLHISPVTMPFVTRKKCVESHTQPYEDSPIVNTYDGVGTNLSVVARIRNIYNNLWLELADGSFVWAGNTAFDFDTALDYTQYYTWTAGGSEDDFTVIDWFGSMVVGFKSGGTFDYKINNMLGASSYKYYVLLDGEIQEERFTGETIGNINYGYAMASAGISKPDSFKFGKIGAEPLSLFTIDGAMCFDGFLPLCDDANDLAAITRGWNYFNNGSWR